MIRSTTLILLAGVLLVDPADAQKAGTYVVDAAESDVHWRVYKAGAFSRFGHNHVVSAPELSGSVTHYRNSARSSFDLVIPVAGLAIDDPELRKLYGEDFSSVPTEDDIAGTRRNMLSETVLDGQRYPELRIHGRIVSGTLDAATVAITVEMLGRRIELSVPGSIVFAGDELVASGEFSLTHADLGMQPFSVMMGALAVGERLDFAYRVRAVREQ